MVKGEHTERFINLFAGGTQAHGLWDTETGARTIRKPATREDYAHHLAGELGLGVVPIRKDGTCRFAAVDIDIDTIDHAELLKKVTARKFPLSVCRSKSGGAHLYLFIEEPGLPAQQVQDTLKRWAALLGYPGSEIFPKQTKVGAKNLGNWINLPYFGSDETTRYAVGPKGSLTFAAFLKSITYYDPAVTVDESAPEALAKMPPCLRALTLNGLPEGQRNMGLFNFAVFFRKSNPTGWQQQVTEHNQNYVDPPLTYTEVQTIIGSVGQTKYQYTCTQQPIASFCDKPTCSTLQFGVGNMPWEEHGTFDEILTSHLRKLLTTPPRYILEISGQDVTFTTQELLRFPLFRAKVMEVTDLLPAPQKQTRWESELRDLLKTKVDIEAPPDASPEGIVITLFHQFVSVRERADDVEALNRGIPVIKDKVVLFRAQDLKRYLRARQATELKMQDVFLLLREEGCSTQRIRVLGRHLHVWNVPLERINEQTEEFSITEPEPSLDNKEEL